MKIAQAQIAESVQVAFKVHSESPKKPSKAFRKFDGQTPYGAHPTWCAMTLLTEATLPEEVRARGAKALCYHDIPEDTNASLPEGTEAVVCQLVKDMTFDSFADELQEIWPKSDEVKLLKLYDKVSNLLDGSWMDQVKMKTYVDYVTKLATHVEKVYGQLNIVAIAKAIVWNRSLGI